MSTIASVINGIPHEARQDAGGTTVIVGGQLWRFTTEGGEVVVTRAVRTEENPAAPIGSPP